MPKTASVEAEAGPIEADVALESRAEAVFAEAEVAPESQAEAGPDPVRVLHVWCFFCVLVLVH